MDLLHWFRVCYLYLSTCLYVQTVCGRLTLISDAGRSCICPEDVVTYECTVMSGSHGATIFRGNPSSFYDCTGDSNNPTEIVFHHSQFNNSLQSTCNNGTVVGQSLSNDGTYHKSQLNITVTSELIGDTIKCVHDNGTHRDIVGQSKMNNTALSSPIKLHLSKVDFQSNQLTFDWNPVAPDCQAIEYHILASNCGSCLATTSRTSVTCFDIPADGMCIFFVETVVCGSIVTNQNDTLNITLNRSVLPEKALNADLLPALVSTNTILLLIIISLLCYILVNRRKRLNSDRSNSIQMPNTYSTSCETKNVSYEDVTKVFDNQSMGMYGPLDYEEPVKAKVFTQVKGADQPLDLNHLLIYLRDQLNSQWYLYGLAIGVPKEFLKKLHIKEHSKDDCLPEVLDYWLRHHPGTPTWSEVIEAKKKLEFFNSAQKLTAN